MRIILLLVLWLHVTYSGRAQVSQTTAKADYLKKSKTQKRTANLLLIGGGALVATAFIFPRGEPEYHNALFFSFTTYPNDNIKGWILLTGTVAMLGSVPFYLSSAKNKRRARAITLNLQNQDIVIPNHSTLVLKRQPSVTLKLAL